MNIDPRGVRAVCYFWGAAFAIVLAVLYAPWVFVVFAVGLCVAVVSWLIYEEAIAPEDPYW